MNIIEKKTSELIPYENNPRFNDETVEPVANSIRSFGFKVPIVIDSNNVIVTGHTRLKAAEELGLKTVPCIIADDLNEQQIQAYRLADNKVSELASWDFDSLADELADITDFDMGDFGFDVDMSLDEPAETVEDDYDEEPPVEPKAKLGDIYQLGRHRLMCGDSTDPAVIDRLMNGKKADLLLTDPPYGVKAVESGGHNNGEKAGSQIARDNKYAPIIGDDTTDTAKANYEVAKEYSENQIIFGGNYFTDFLYPSRCWVVWDKKVAGSFADGELAWTSFDRNLKIYEHMWSGMRREGDRAIEGKTRVHPTQKPVGMLANILKDFSDEGGLILDCFGGSGSTLIACEQLNRKCYMCELDPHYCDVIIDRWEKFTGQKAVKL
ncbi:MAG: ParB N-terminal domain-containing protein [Ruminococcus sp.]|nr:ParB N-terminal domain-containing protein [Ruminococcus sp.]